VAIKSPSPAPATPSTDNSAVVLQSPPQVISAKPVMPPALVPASTLASGDALRPDLSMIQQSGGSSTGIGRHRSLATDAGMIAGSTPPGSSEGHISRGAQSGGEGVTSLVSRLASRLTARAG
jgi:hypothetical protein